MGTADTTLNSADLGAKFHLRRRLVMIPLRIGVGEWVPDYDFMLKLLARLLVFLVTVLFFGLYRKGCVAYTRDVLSSKDRDSMSINQEWASAAGAG